MKTKKYFILIYLTLLIIYSCNNKQNTDNNKKYVKDNESLERINETLVNRDAEVIKNFINRNRWDMSVTEAGLYYMIYKKGNGPKVEEGKTVIINYEISLMDGTVCYKSDSSHPKSFVVGKGNVESGLEQGILLMRKGDKAKFILPPHLAYGLLGDENKIPPRSVIVYDVEVLDICN
jgi:FKBP-type peptidyl-prolyl cis-trans isomerase